MEFKSSPNIEAALCELLGYLQSEKYQFITGTPLTHSRVLKNHHSASANEAGRTLTDIFGWSLTFTEQSLPAKVLKLMQTAQILEQSGSHLKSKVRVSSIGSNLFLHSAFPTEQQDAVFFGPDTYRFVRFMRQALQLASLRPNARILDIGCGSGAGGLVIAKENPASHLVLNDLNPLALQYSAANAKHLGVSAEFAMGDSVSSVSGDFDLIIANPPYLMDSKDRTYRDGGDDLGSSLSLRMAKDSMSRLTKGGRLLLYTGVAIQNGRDGFAAKITDELQAAGFQWSYEEMDPDVFGEELEKQAYKNVDRIAAVGLLATRV